jgi:hypothetical protein
MAETLSVAEMIPNKFEPKRKNRWVFALEGIDAFLMKSAARPSVQIQETEFKYINSTRYLAGRSTFGDLQITIYDAIAPSGAQQVMEWIRTHYESVSGRAGYADFYKRDCQLKMLDPVGTVIELWDIKGAHLTNVTFGDVSYDDDAPTEISMTLRFDNCVLQY